MVKLRMTDIDEERRQRGIELAEQGRKAGQAAWRAKAHAYWQRQEELLERRRREAEIEHERARAERLKLAEVLIQEWDRRVTAYAFTLQDPDRGPAWAEARRGLVAFGMMLREHPEAVEALRERGEAVGWEKQPHLERLLASEEPAQLIDRMLTTVEHSGMEPAPAPHAPLKEQAIVERPSAQILVR